MAAYPPFGSQYQQSANSNSSSQPKRGRVLFVSSSRQSKLSRKNLEDLLRPANKGEIGGPYPRQFHFKLTDKDGNTVAGKGMDHIVFIYPGHPGQALNDPNSGSINFSNRRKTNEVQIGAGLAEIAYELTKQGKHALALPTTFTRRDEQGKPRPHAQQQYNFYWDYTNPIHMLNREQLARLQLHYVEEILNRGRDVVIFVIRVINNAFQAHQSMVSIDGQDYYLAFWGGIEPGDEAGFLPTLYFQEIERLARGEALSESISKDVVPAFGGVEKQVNIGPLLNYMRQRETEGAGFTFFGGFSKAVKLAAATKMIFKLAELNGFVSTMEHQVPILSVEEHKALNEENSDLHKAVETTLEGVSDENIRGAILEWMNGSPSHRFSL